MNDKPLQSTLREMQRLSRDSRSWAVLVALSLVVGMTGPFGTYEVMGLLPRLAYWTAIVVGTATTGTLIASVVERQLRRLVEVWIATLVAGAAAGPPIAILIALLSWATFGRQTSVIDLPTLLIYCTLISMAVTLLSAILGARPRSAMPAGDQPDIGEPALLDRLPRPYRGRLLHIAVSDHYVDVTTDKGVTLVLMRFADAIRETAPVAGLQVHRSHWVALDAVRRSTRQGGKLLLELENGATVPVSRTYMHEVKTAQLV